MKLLVVTVNYTSAKYVLQCLKRLVPQLKAVGDAELWIVDNNSPDDSVDTLHNSIAADGLEHLVQLIKSPVNGGFGAGNNIAFRKALELPEPPSYIYLLNPDTIPEPGTVNSLLNFMEKHPDVGVVGGALRDEQNNLQCSTFRFPSLLSEIEGSLKLGLVTKLLRNYRVPMETPKEATPVDWVTGANMMIRRDVIEQVGMFDENFFLYWEETDLCRRIQNAKYNIYFVPNASVLHISGVTTGMSSSRQKKRIPLYWLESRAYYIKKTFGSTKLIVFNLIVALCIFLHRVRQYFGRVEMEPPHLMRDFIRYNFLPKHSKSVFEKSKNQSVIK
jgi:N-acetylglucosaminyl-diphospho-decaprenol L-rhamnosyltransferase